MNFEKCEFCFADPLADILWCKLTEVPFMVEADDKCVVEVNDEN